jgi:two-component system, NarL family, sensor histidine kinase DesK
MRLLPKDAERELGFTPYVWLIYLVPFVAQPFVVGASWLERLATLAAALVFLALYFAGHWYGGRRLLAIVVAIAALGALFAPWNSAASALFIYAAAHAAWVGPPRVALRVVLAVIAVVLVESAWLQLSPYFWILTVVFSGIIGGVCIHSAETVRKNACLREAREEVERMAKVAERERIARDLHDLLGHTLSVIVLKSELAAKLGSRDPAAAVAEILDVERISREALQQVRAAVTGYRSSIAAEVARASEALQAAGVAFEPRVEAVTLASAAESVLALAIREAVTNVVRHAGARHCRLRLQRNGDRASLTIEDDGKGGEAVEGTGLASMRERLAALGGSLERCGEAGTRLAISIPLGGAA